MMDELRHFWQILSHPRSWWTHTRFWWYTGERERIIVLTSVVLVSLTVGILAYRNIQQAASRPELHCLALNIYHEARGEPRAGQFAVGEVTMNRVMSPDYPDTICEVVHQRHWDPKRKRYSHAFSWTRSDYAVNLHSTPWLKAMDIAEAVYYDDFDTQLDGAMFYHARYVKPGWSKRYQVVAKIGKHIFYK